ncbi:hypothetical protein [Methanoculleus sp. 10]|uniref:hypothetical protein n=1 Tax=Methanoculleus sp. 10 TaxID=430615 RepID=UPI0025E7BD3F|nr:hypothetical protein [Methanoculleus sp. 10]
MLAVSSAAAETLDDTGASLTESITSDMVIVAATPLEEMTAVSTEAPDEPPVQTSALTAEPVILFNGTVALADGTFECTAYNSGTAYTVQNKTPLGALQAVAERKGLTYDVTDKKWDASKILLLDNIGEYKFVKSGPEWTCYVNGALKDGYSDSNNAVNVVALANGDKVVFCYGNSPTPEDASVLIKITVGVEDSEEPPVQPIDWTITLKGALTETIDQKYFEDGIACGHAATYTDENGGVWKGMPLWYSRRFR